MSFNEIITDANLELNTLRNYQQYAQYYNGDWSRHPNYTEVAVVHYGD